ncbi:intraflagellar transport particle protein 74/72 [Klebsormidium nitens]|uniref:Intraflagellar transport particle protein 74/72 n=1 Tax=Klebsormidium nitens TaxID=105231 RepID=A0A1Y1HM71_KLENI|nr:intraflagellar transport particle protein 74/72 [Klebsormidium nitens]|eukprot:GAQ77667.1 intraflagellar transport particle protein 74/72 [Klebsormidium nitens]
MEGGGPFRPSTGQRASMNGGMQPPPTAYRQSAAGYAAPGTAKAGMRGLASRGGGRPGTGSVGLNTDVQVSERPVTQQGLVGMKTGSQGPGRQIADKSYYLTRLRAKKQELQAEIDSLTSEMGRFQKDDTTSAQLERKLEGVTKEVKGLQGQLADYNFVLDKVGHSVPLEQLKEELRTIQEQNARQRRKVDGLFTERAQKEQQVREAEAEAERIQRGMETRLNELGPERRQQYLDLQQENRQLAAVTADLERQLADMNGTLAAMEKELSSSSIKQRALVLQQQIRALDARKRELQVEEQRPQLSPEEAREQLIQKMRRDNTDIAAAEQQIRELEDALRRDESALDSLNAELTEQHDEKDEEKFRELQSKDRDMQGFIDGYEEKKAASEQMTADAQQNIVRLLEKISLGHEHQAQHGTKGHLDVLEDDAHKHLEPSQATPQKLLEAIHQRSAELDKINVLEGKIAEEVASINEKMEQMRRDMGRFSNETEAKDSWEARKKDLEAERATGQHRKDELARQIQEGAAALDARRAQLSGNEHWVVVDKLEHRMRVLQQNNRQAQDILEARGEEMDCKPVLMEVTNLLTELNTQCQKAALV